MMLKSALKKIVENLPICDWKEIFSILRSSSATYHVSNDDILKSILILSLTLCK